MARWYAIREKATGLLFPAGRAGRNVSFLEFDERLPPRLFSRRQDALYVARWWADGHTWNRGRYSEDDSFDWQTKPVPGRHIDKLEIVGINLTEAP